MPAGMDTANKVVCARILQELDAVADSISNTTLCGWDYICDYKVDRSLVTYSRLDVDSDRGFNLLLENGWEPSKATDKNLSRYFLVISKQICLRNDMEIM